MAHPRVAATLTVRFSCRVCGLVDVAAEVPVRGPSEDVVHWVEQIVGHAIKAVHTQRSPRCAARAVADLKIPIDGAHRIGDRPTVH